MSIDLSRPRRKHPLPEISQERRVEWYEDRQLAGCCRLTQANIGLALKSSASANARYANGVAVFTLGEGGLLYEASVGGQKFSYEPK